MRAPDKAAVVRADGTVQTYLELDAEVSGVTRRLLALGLLQGDRIALLGRNDPSHIKLLLACAAIDAVVVILNWRLTVDELVATITDADPVMLLCSASFEDAAQAVSSRVASLPVGLSNDEDLIRALDSGLTGSLNIDPAARKQPSPQGDLLLCYTSGSSGQPKGVRLTHENLRAACAQALAHTPWRWGEGSVALCALPLFHIAGLRAALFPTIFGATAVFIADTQPTTILRALIQHRIEKLSIVPTLLAAVLADPAFEQGHLGALETVFYGGAPMPEALLNEVRTRLRCDLVQIYGLTETSGAALSLDSDDHVESSVVLKSCGKPLPGVLLELRPAPTDDAPHREGEVWLAGSTIAAGYWRRPSETAIAFMGTWFRTGDLGSLDDKGYLYLKGRLGDVIKSGGEKVMPNEVEETLMRHPGVKEAAVVGVPDPEWGEKVVAAIVLRSGASGDSQEILQYCRRTLAGFKVPKQIMYMASLPRNANGKLVRATIRQGYSVASDTSEGDTQ